MQHFYSIPNQIPERFWVLKSPIVNGVFNETLFFDEQPLFKDSYTCESPFAISLCDFTGIDPVNAEKHYRECFNIAEIAKEEVLTEDEIDYELALEHANEVRNALQELKNDLSLDSILCGYVEIFSSLQKEEIDVQLKVGYTKEDLERFCNSINVNYDAGYGGQEVYGTIWLKDGTWLTREEYDGSEWWSHHTVPVIPDVLKG